MLEHSPDIHENIDKYVGIIYISAHYHGVFYMKFTTVMTASFDRLNLKHWSERWNT